MSNCDYRRKGLEEQLGRVEIYRVSYLCVDRSFLVLMVGEKGTGRYTCSWAGRILRLTYSI